MDKRTQVIFQHLAPKAALVQQSLKQQNQAWQKKNKKLVGFPRTVGQATLFSRFMERVYTKTEQVKPESDLIEMPKGEPPPLEKVFRHVYDNPRQKRSGGGFGGGHVVRGSNIFNF